MKLLTLIRHAKSSWKQYGVEDSARPLNGRGKRDAAMMGQRLAAIGFLPDAFLTSPAKRARGTARRLAKEIGFPKSHIALEEEIYHAMSDRLLNLIRRLDDSRDHVALVGHNPGFTELSGLLSQDYIGDVPTCGVVRLELDVSSWQEVERNCGRLLDFDFPKRDAHREDSGAPAS
ncbi:MAG: histidine phosphatase family protein [Chloroflexi bacterium]|nr:histidine phosphatase family protein [Chloroflexota bacterium]